MELNNEFEPVYSIDTSGIEMRLDDLRTFLEECREEAVHPALETPFEEYTVSETLLLLLLLAVVGSWLVRLVKGGLSWLFW